MIHLPEEFKQNIINRYEETRHKMVKFNRRNNRKI